MAKQVSLFSFFETAKKHKVEEHALSTNAKKSKKDLSVQVEVNSVVKKLIDDVIKAEKFDKPNLDDVMTMEKLKKWPMKFTFWDTEDGKVSLFV